MNAEHFKALATFADGYRDLVLNAQGAGLEFPCPLVVHVAVGDGGGGYEVWVDDEERAQISQSL